MAKRFGKTENGPALKQLLSIVAHHDQNRCYRKCFRSISPIAYHRLRREAMLELIRTFLKQSRTRIPMSC
jgi:hypothetical protein